MTVHKGDGLVEELQPYRNGTFFSKIRGKT